MILGTFHGIRVGLNHGPDGQYVYSFEGSRTGVGLSATEVEAMLATAAKIKADGVVVKVLEAAVEAGRQHMAEAV